MPSTVCQMLIRPWHDDKECGQPAIGTHERNVRVCAECAIAMRLEGFPVDYDGVVAFHFTTPTARVGEQYRFIYPNEPQYNRDLLVVEVTGTKPDDLVFFDDGSHTKQKHLSHDLIQRLL